MNLTVLVPVLPGRVTAESTWCVVSRPPSAKKNAVLSVSSTNMDCQSQVSLLTMKPHERFVNCKLFFFAPCVSVECRCGCGDAGNMAAYQRNNRRRRFSAAKQVNCVLVTLSGGAPVTASLCPTDPPKIRSQL